MEKKQNTAPQIFACGERILLSFYPHFRRQTFLVQEQKGPGVCFGSKVGNMSESYPGLLECYFSVGIDAWPFSVVTFSLASRAQDTGELLSPAPSSRDCFTFFVFQNIGLTFRNQILLQLSKSSYLFHCLHTRHFLNLLSLPFLSDLTLLVLKQVLTARVSSFWVEYLSKPSEVFPYPYSELLLVLTAYPCGLFVCLLPLAALTIQNVWLSPSPQL